MRNVEALARDEPWLVVAALLCDKDGSCGECPATGFCTGADARADREWLMAELGVAAPSRTCGSCFHSRMERHTGDERRVCWFWRSFGHIVDDAHFCGYWRPAAQCQNAGAGGGEAAAVNAPGEPDDGVSKPLYRFRA